MDKPNFKDIFQNLDFIKNYASLLLPIIIVLVAVILLIPGQLMSKKLNEQVWDESISQGLEKIESLQKSVPSRDQWKVVEEYQQAFENDAKQISNLSLATTKRQLLSYKIFPEPKETSSLIFKEFGSNFCKAIEDLVIGINARDCPSEAELERSLEEQKSRKSSTSRRKSYGNLRGLDAEIKEILCLERAESTRVYVNLSDVSGYDFWSVYEYKGLEQAIEDCWYWQAGYWVIEDVIKTLDMCNAGSESIFTSPIKRLMNIKFSDAEFSTRKNKSAADGDKIRPKYVSSVDDVLAESFTGRISDKDIDVVHFRLSVITSANYVLAFMKELSSAKSHSFFGWDGNGPEQRFKHNQITILESGIWPIYREDEDHALYRYGDDATVELELTCEYVFYKKAYEDVRFKAKENEDDRKKPKKKKSKKKK